MRVIIRYKVEIPLTEFIVPDYRGTKFTPAYRVVDTTTLCRSQLYPPVMDYQFGYWRVETPWAGNFGHRCPRGEKPWAGEFVRRCQLEIGDAVGWRKVKLSSESVDAVCRRVGAQPLSKSGDAVSQRA